MFVRTFESMLCRGSNIRRESNGRYPHQCLTYQFALKCGNFLECGNAEMPPTPITRCADYSRLKIQIPSFLLVITHARCTMSVSDLRRCSLDKAIIFTAMNQRGERYTCMVLFNNSSSKNCAFFSLQTSSTHVINSSVDSPVALSSR